MNVESLTLARIEGYDPRPSRRGKWLRAKCPVHGGDHQQSLSVDTETGWGRCFSCGVTVRVSDFVPPGERPENRWRVEGVATCLRGPRVRPEPTVPARGNAALTQSVERLAGSSGEDYLARRRIPLSVAQRYGVGFVGKGSWPGRKIARRWPRLTFPLATPEGVVNWYSRAASADAPRSEAHDILSGPKGYFHFAALRQYETVLVVEAALDGLSLAAAGRENFVALIGTQHFRAEWFLEAGVQKIILALDHDEAGRKAAEEIAWKAVAVGLGCTLLPEAVYAGEKDLNAALVKVGRLDWPGLPLSALPLPAEPAGAGEPLAPEKGIQERSEQLAALVEAWHTELAENPNYPDAPENAG